MVNPTYTLYLYESDGVTPIAEGAVISVYPYGVSQVDANLVERETVQPGGTGTVYLNQLEVGGDYALVGNDGSEFSSSFFQAGAARSGSVVSGATGGGGGGGGSAPSTQVAAMAMAQYSDDSVSSAPPNATTALFSSSVDFSGLSGAGLGTDFFNSQCPQISAFADAVPATADSLRFELNIQANLTITPPGSGDYPDTEQLSVLLTVAELATGLSIASSQVFADSVTVVAATGSPLYLQCRMVWITNVTDEPYIDFMPQLTVLSNTEYGLQIGNVECVVDASVTAFKSVTS